MSNGERRTGIEVARRLLLAIAVLGIAATLVGLLLVQRIGTTYRDGLRVTRDGADVAAVSSQSAAQLAGDVSALAESAVASLQEAQDLITLGAQSSDDIGVAMGTNLATTVEGTANIANGMAGFVEAIESIIPGDSHSLAEDLRALADGLEPVPEQLRTLGQQLQDTADTLTSTNGSLDDVATQLAALSTSIDEATATLEEVDTLAQDLSVRAEAALDRSGTDFWLLRILIVLLGAGVAATCLAAHRALGALAPTTSERREEDAPRR